MISVVIPAYNRENTIRRCIDSVLEQSYQEIEIIVINDGSQDRTGDICRQYNDPRLIYVEQKNQGVSRARNTGLRLAHGTYVSFIDSDDYIEPNYLATLINGIGDSELCIGGWKTDTLDISLKSGNVCVPEDHDDIMGVLFQKGALNPVWGKLFILDKIIQNKLCFEQELGNGEDLDFVCQYLSYCRTIHIVTQCGYHYTADAGNTITANGKSYLHDYLLLHKRNISWNKSKGFLYSMYSRYRCDIEHLMMQHCFDGERSKHDLNEIKKVLKQENVMRAFSSYHPVSFTDWLVHQLMKRGRLDLLCAIFKMKSLFRK